MDPKAKGFHGDEGFKRGNKYTATETVIGEASIPIQEGTGVLSRHVFFFHEMFEIHFSIIEHVTVL